MKTILNGIRIKAISSWLPTHILEMQKLSSIYAEEQVNNIIKTTGVERVRIADKAMTASDMCQQAAEYLIYKEDMEKSNIDGLVFVSQTTDFLLPSTSVCLQERLGLSKETICIDIHYGCSGYIYGIFQAALWITTGVCKNVLVLAGDTTSRLINENDRASRMVFGECGTATLVTTGDFPIGFNIQSDGSGADKLIVPAGGFRTPASNETAVLEWDEDHNGRTKNDLYMDGLAVFSFATTCVPKNICELLEVMKWNKEDVGLFALHQANNFVVNYIARKLKEPDKVPTNVMNYGNTGPSSIPLIFSDLCTDGKYKLDKVVSCGFGVGFSWGSFATDLSQTTFYSPINK
ncbi:MAG: ketoacyl-ACP synthase III [Bacteroides sp.]|nr:ketoacyl-ACP synthase III [Bacteroides sp.]